MDRKEQVHSLVNELGRSKNYEANIARELIGLMLEQAKDALVDAMGEDLLRRQGEAKAFERLHRELMNPRITQQEPE